MNISKITISNFRVYQGTQLLEFDSDKKNISIICGDNGSGKTTFLTSLVWCLYGKYISDVDEVYRKEVLSSGGYSKFLEANLNNNQRSKYFKLKKTFAVELKKSSEVTVTRKINELDRISTYYVEIVISNPNIPSIPSKEVTIRRSFCLNSSQESLALLIDGLDNQLTQDLGSQVFINDFILPKEIAKFFFFDSEKIVSLAEMSSIIEKRKLSKAYSEVIGLKKYEDLIENLKRLKSKFRRDSALEKNKMKLNKLYEEIKAIDNLISEYHDKIQALINETNIKRRRSEQLQEKLIREGNTMSAEELIIVKKKLELEINEGSKIRNSLKELIEFIPFAISGNKIRELKEQVDLESFNKQQYSETEVDQISKRLSKNVKKKVAIYGLSKQEVKDLIDTINRSLKNQLLQRSKQDNKRIFLDFKEKDAQSFHSLFDYLKGSFHMQFQDLVEKEKRNRVIKNKLIKKISNAEINSTDGFIKGLKDEKLKVDQEIVLIEEEIRDLHRQIGESQTNRTSSQKIASELENKIQLSEKDLEKEETINRILHELKTFLRSFKERKRRSLEDHIAKTLKKLMHKKGFIRNVKVEFKDDYFDFHLIDHESKQIDKDALSKGEQQLYATSILKALIEETEISFPIVVDSPLQKFDRIHADNILTEFYPNVSEEVILLPLLEKELTENEFNMLLPFIKNAFIISNTKNHSGISKIEPSKLFLNYHTIN